MVLRVIRDYLAVPLFDFVRHHPGNQIWLDNVWLWCNYYIANNKILSVQLIYYLVEIIAAECLC